VEGACVVNQQHNGTAGVVGKTSQRRDGGGQLCCGVALRYVQPAKAALETVVLGLRWAAQLGLSGGVVGFDVARNQRLLRVVVGRAGYDVACCFVRVVTHVNQRVSRCSVHGAKGRTVADRGVEEGGEALCNKAVVVVNEGRRRVQPADLHVECCVTLGPVVWR
jgi:hypothetical protein